MAKRQPHTSDDSCCDGGGDKVYVRAPLSTWQIVVEVATLKDCRNVLLNYKKHPYETTDPKVEEALKLRFPKASASEQRFSIGRVTIRVGLAPGPVQGRRRWIR